MTTPPVSGAVVTQVVPAAAKPKEKIMIEIALAGAMGAGKTTVANELVRTHLYHRLSFADPIRYLTQTLLGRPVEKKFDRPVLQKVGRAARSPEWKSIDTPLEPARQERVASLAAFIFPEATPERIQALYRVLYDEKFSYGWGQENYWIERWHHDYLRSAKPVALDDCRFPVEGAYLQRLGFFVVRLDVPLPERQRRIIQRDGHWDDKWTNDPTELHVDEIPVNLVLDGTDTPENLAERIYQEALSWEARKRGRPKK